MKKLIIGVFMALTMSATTAFADYTLIVPQAPGKGTSVWSEIIAKNLEKFIGESVVVRHIPGARDIPGFNKFHNSLRFDDKTIMVAHGGNGVSFLLDKIDYNYFDYELMGSMNNDIVLGKHAGADEKSGNWTIAGGSGFEPDAAAVAMLLCGPQGGNTVDDYLKCWRERVTWVNGVSGGEKRLGFKNGEFDVARESPAAWKRFYEGIEGNELWFTHGILDLENKVQMADPNFPGTQFEDLYEKLWGEAPKGDLYEAYRLTRNWRDAIQKSLWVNKGNPNAEKIKAAVTEMINDPVASAEIYAKTGTYPWIQDGPELLATLKSLITEKALKDAVKWNQEAYGFPSIYKPELLK
tara:strand:+ start:768 stop:1823 length:1056 start_codon:yes stop_codon:yes gene_type:complete